MKVTILKFALLLGLLIFFTSCLDQKDIVGISTHPSGWQDRLSKQFHGAAVKSSISGAENCKTCHGEDYTGGTSGKSCYTSECHESYPHKEGFSMDVMSANFHGSFIREDSSREILSCQPCHGENYTGGTAEISCYLCHSYYPHKDEFENVSSPNSHTLFISDSLDGSTVGCKTCHGANYAGGTSQVSCFQCHSNYPHKNDFAEVTSDNFHGDFIREQLSGDLTTCKSCHGADYKGGTSQVSCYQCHSSYPHKSDFAEATSFNFHGSLIIEQLSGDLATCQSCHGEDLKGGTSDVSCYKCHSYYPHDEGFANKESLDFHGNFIKESINWDITDCQSCHGTDYGGKGVAEKNCLTCHTETNGPEACSTCHGSSINPAPPVDTDGNTSTKLVTVGAHQFHVTGSRYTTNMLGNCSTCHQEVTNFSNAGHINDDTEHAEVIFNSLATGDGMSDPQWDRSSGTCNNVYCHGAFSFAYQDSLMLGNYRSVIWNEQDKGGINQALCGTCHLLPPIGHDATFKQCGICHSSVVNNDLEIIDKSKHINGKIDLR